MKFINRLKGMLYGWRMGYTALTTDALTGLRSRQYFEYEGRQCLERRARRNRQVAVVNFDIDRLGLVNDFFGHAAADYVLRRAGEVIINQVRRDSDYAFRRNRSIEQNRDLSEPYRMGGDEFSVFLGKTTDMWALDFAMRVQEDFYCVCRSAEFRETIARLRLNSADSTGVSLSLVLDQVGLTFAPKVIEVSGDIPIELDSALIGADEKLILLKRAGQ